MDLLCVRLCVVLALAFVAMPVRAQAEAVTPPNLETQPLSAPGAEAGADLHPGAREAEPSSLAEAGIAAASAGIGAAGGYLLALPVGVALVYLLPLVGVSPLFGAVPLLLGVPLGAGLAAGLFAQGVTPLGATLAGSAALFGAGAATLGIVAYTLVASPADYDGVVLAAVTVPAIAGAACAAITAPLVGLE